MESFSLVYLVQRFFYRLFDFFHHWYVDGSRAFGHAFITALAEVDKVVAIKITLRYLFQPLYKDYTVIGRILGIIFRTIRILVGAVIYLILVAAFLVAYLIWILIPAAILVYAVR
jgi:hypothetical protein